MTDEKPRVLHIGFNDLGHGGLQAVIMTLTEKLKDDIKTDIVVFKSEPAYYDKAFENYGKIIRRPHYEGASRLRKKLDYYFRYYRIKRDILHVIRDYGPYDVVHSHTFFEAAPCLAAAKKAGVPVRIAHSHNTAMEDNSRFPAKQIKALYRRIYRGIIRKNATHMVGCSQAAADYLFGPGAGQAINNSVDLERFDPALYPQEPRSTLQLIHVGKFTVQKNQLFLAVVMNELVIRRKDVSLTMIGAGDEYLSRVKTKIEQLELADHIEIKPHDSDVAAEMTSSDYCVFPSNFEGFGNVLLEAQAIGLHCFVSTEVTKEVDCGLCTYIELGKGAARWAETILEHAEKHGTEKNPADMSRFSEEIFARRFLDIYRRKA